MKFLRCWTYVIYEHWLEFPFLFLSRQAQQTPRRFSCHRCCLPFRVYLQCYFWCELIAGCRHLVAPLLCQNRLCLFWSRGLTPSLTLAALLFISESESATRTAAVGSSKRSWLWQESSSCSGLSMSRRRKCHWPNCRANSRCFLWSCSHLLKERMLSPRYALDKSYQKWSTWAGRRGTVPGLCSQCLWRWSLPDLGSPRQHLDVRRKRKWRVPW